MDEELGGPPPEGEGRKVKEGDMATEVAGWFGSAAIIIGYAYSWDKLTYFVLNASGGVALDGILIQEKGLPTTSTQCCLDWNKHL